MNNVGIGIVVIGLTYFAIDAESVLCGIGAFIAFANLKEG